LCAGGKGQKRRSNRDDAEEDAKDAKKDDGTKRQRTV